MIKTILLSTVFLLGSSVFAAGIALKKPKPPLPAEISADFAKMQADNDRYEREHAEYKKALAKYEKALAELKK